MNKVYSLPNLEQANQDDSNSINQIVIQVAKHLPKYGWQITDNQSEADLVVAHAGQTFGVAPCDVAHCHGLYPTFHNKEPRWHSGANVEVIKNLRHAKAITVPSQWVGDIIRRELNREPIITNWAFDASIWPMQGAHKAYTLWNKTRMDSVCDPTPIEYLAQHIEDAKFVTTFASKPFPNLDIIGRQTFSKMQDIIQNASLYLATTKETYGIGTLEAMACGIPILGYKWGGTADIVEHGLTGYLVEPDDLEGLVTGWRWCMRHRQDIAYHARAEALNEHYTWDRVAQQFAEVYDDTLQQQSITIETRKDCKVSVIIPVYNYQDWVSLAIDSAIGQDTSFEYEIIIVDDGSTDDSLKVIKQYEDENLNIQVFSIPNGGVANARNFGIEKAIGEYITCLDADDLLGDTHFLQTLNDALDSNPLLGLAYSKLAVFEKDPFNGCHISAWPSHFDIQQQYDGKNQVPTCNMFRKVAWQQAGGYRSHLQPAEDAGLWYMISLYGWDIRMATDKPLFLYRYHPTSLSADVRNGIRDEPAWYNIHEAHRTKRYPMASQLDPTTYSKLPSHPVRNYDNPIFSIIIPVGPRHEQAVIRALDSIASQTEWRWEAIVINDTGHALNLPQKWAKIINQQGAKPKGAGSARNLGIAYAQGKYVIFLDADDMLLPDFIEKTYQIYRAKGAYIYTDWLEEKGHNLKPYTTVPYTQKAIFKKMSIHPITALIPRQWVIEVGGFDEGLEAWEDTDLFIRMAIAGFCGERLARPLMVYNHDSGKRRNIGADQSERLKQIFRDRYGEYLENPKMAKKCCGREPEIKTRQIQATDKDVVRVMMVAGPAGATTLKGFSTKKSYGRKQRGDIFLMRVADVKAAPPDLFVVIADTEEHIQATQEPSAPPKAKVKN